MASKKNHTKLRVGDTVIVTSGSHEGETGKVLRFNGDRSRVFIEGVNKVKRHQKPMQALNRQGGIIEKEASIHVSNVAVQDGSGKPTRIGYKVLASGEKIRVAKSTGDQIPSPR
jgi:large subunit ribosomal protein L24